MHVRREAGGQRNLDAGRAQRSPHAALSAFAAGRWRGDVEGVARHAVTDKFGVNFRAAALSVLEFFQDEDARALAATNTAAVVLPGATLGLGEPFPPARMLLDEGNCVAIASDWNPGTAPMGNLLVQAAVMGAQQKLTMAETWAGVTYRAAASLGLDDRGRLGAGLRMDLAVYPCEDWREVLYYQGSLEPVEVWIGGEHVSG